MDIFKNKFLVKLIASICLFLTLLNFGGASKVYADDDSWGGVLISPIVSLMTAIGDGINDILHKEIHQQEVTIIKINGDKNWASFWKTVALVVGTIVLAVGLILAGGAIAGLCAGAAQALATGTFVFSMKVTLTGVIAGSGIALAVGTIVGNEWFKEDIYLPVFTLSAEEIFSNKINLFDVNFFNPMPDKKIIRTVTGTQLQTKATLTAYETDEFSELTDTYYMDGVDGATVIYTAEKTIVSIMEEDNKDPWIGIVNDFCFSVRDIKFADMYDDARACDYSGVGIEQELRNIVAAIGIESKFDTEDLWVHTWQERPVNGYTTTTGGGEIQFYPGDSDDDRAVIVVFNFDGTIGETTTTEVEEGTIVSTAKQLQEIVSTWYFILRNIALLVLMLLLIYSGIRIVIGSTAGEKAKYKERLMDWLVALCLVMIMHYIMVFAVNLVNEITEIVAKTNNKGINSVYIPLSTNQYNNAKEIDWSEFGDVLQKQDENISDVAKSESGYVLVWQTDIMGLFRIQAQLENKGTAEWVGYSFCYVVLVLFTLFFAFTYAKRVIYMAFLTLIAPLVAMTYPIDKITDGKAQAFDSWLKEYIFNLMIQPLHLLLYTILVTSAYQLASTNAIYSLCAIGFMLPAEKLMRRFFGFEKAKTPGLLGGAAGAALAMTGLQNLMKPRHHGGKSNGNDEKTNDQNKLTFARRSNVNAMETIAGGEPTGTTSTSQTSMQNDSSPAMGEPTNGSQESGEPQDEDYGGYGNVPYQTPQSNEAEDTDTTADFGEATPISTFEQTKAARAAYEKTPNRNPRSFKEIKAANDKINRARRGRAIKGFATEFGRQLGMKVLTGVHPLKTAGKLAAGATAGTAGLLLGIASGDPNKAFQYTTTAAMAGTALAGSLSGNEILDAEKLKKETEMAYYGAEYKQHEIDKQRKAFLKNKANINYIRQTMGKSEEEARSILETTGEQCFNNGITNIEDIATIHQLTENDSMSFNQALAAREYATKRLPSDTDKMTARTIQQHKDRWANEYKDKYQNLSKKQAEALADKSFELAIRFNKAKSGLTKMP